MRDWLNDVIYYHGRIYWPGINMLVLMVVLPLFIVAIIVSEIILP